MAVSHPPYHLRTNKAVDRILFLDQMQNVIPPNLRGGRYYSLGGPFMEDLRLVHRRFSSKPLVCLESDSQTHKRQQAHKFTRKLVTKHTTLANFLTHDYQPENRDVFWLDFTDFSLRGLSDFQQLLGAILPGSLVRITVRCEPPINERVLHGYVEENEIAGLKDRAYVLMKQEFARLIPPEWVERNPANYAEYSVFIQQIIRLAVSEVMDRGRDREFLHLTSARYDDGTQMLSVTGLICERGDLRAEIARLRASNQPHDVLWRRRPDVINVPYLSMQERMCLDERLPLGPKATGLILQRKLGYWVGNSARSSVESLKQYADYYQEYPSFMRMAY